MLRVCVLFYRPRCLQMISLLCLLLLLLSVQTLLAVMEHSKLEQIELGSTIHAAFNELEPIHLPFDRAIRGWRVRGGLLRNNPQSIPKHVSRPLGCEDLAPAMEDDGGL